MPKRTRLLSEIEKAIPTGEPISISRNFITFLGEFIRVKEWVL